MQEVKKQTIDTLILKDTTANPAPLGLLGFGLTTVLLNIHNAGYYELNSMILAMGIFYGGLAQIIAGIMEWKKNNTFGTTAFTSYGLFWLTLVGLAVSAQAGACRCHIQAGLCSLLLYVGAFHLRHVPGDASHQQSPAVRLPLAHHTVLPACRP